MQNIVTNDQKNSLALTIQENDLADMILNFLGKKETLTYKKENINFEVRLNDIEQFYYLLNGKITKELHSNITHFSVLFFYHDNTTREINEIETLNTFLELRDVFPIKIILSWNIILSFPNTQKIENQEINVDFDMSDSIHSTSILIKHTNSIWGTEVLNLFKEHIKTLTFKKPKTLIISEDIIHFFTPREVILSIMPIILMITLLTISRESINNLHIDAKKIEIVSKLINNNSQSLSRIEEALIPSIIYRKNYDSQIIQLIKDKETKELLTLYQKEKKKDTVDYNTNTYIYLGSILAFLLATYFLLKQNIKYLSKKSVILTTKRAEKAYEVYKHSKSKTEYYSFSLIAFSIIIGLIVNAIFQFMS